jgi:hypothetical protein
MTSHPTMITTTRTTASATKEDDDVADLDDESDDFGEWL